MKAAFIATLTLAVLSVIGMFGCFLAAIWTDHSGRTDQISQNLAGTGFVLFFAAFISGFIAYSIAALAD
jgi:hypothetical protein